MPALLSSLVCDGYKVRSMNLNVSPCPAFKLAARAAVTTEVPALPSAVCKDGKLTYSPAFEHLSEHEQRWADLHMDMNYLTKSGRLVQWYPGHIAKAERDLKEQLRVVDVVIEVLDARIPTATSHPELDTWIGDKMKLVVMNRVDMISMEDKNAWANYFARQGISALFTDGQLGTGTMKLYRTAKLAASDINEKRKKKGLLPRSVRAAVVGYPNVGKSSLINRLLKRRVCEAASRAGVTRELKWSRIGEGLDLLDAPGILPMRLEDQAAATRLAICNDIGVGSYAVAGVAGVLVEMIKRMPTAGAHILLDRYRINVGNTSGELFLEELAQRLFNGDVNQAARRVLIDYQKGRLGWLALERPPGRLAEFQLSGGKQ